MTEEEKKQRKQVAKWQKEGKTAEQMRKRRNHILILLGSVTLGNIRMGKVDQEEIIKELPENKQEGVREWLDSAN